MKRKVKIEIKEWAYDCADGCCTNYGTDVFVNGQKLDATYGDTSQILVDVLEYLGYQVQLTETYDYD